MTLSIMNGGYVFSVRLNLMLLMSLWKEFELLQILNDLSTKCLIKLILFLYENDVKLLKYKRRSVQVDYWNVWSVILCVLILQINTSMKAIECLICFFIVNLMLGCLLFKKLKNLMNLVPCQKQLEWHQHILNKI